MRVVTSARTVMFVIRHMNIGGAQRQLFNLAVGLDRDRFRPLVVCLQREEPLMAELRERGVETFCLPARRSIDPTLPPRLARLARRTGARILHGYLFQANAWARMAARLARIPITVASVRTGRPHRRRMEVMVERALSGWTAAYVVNAQAVGRRLAEQIPGAAERIVCIYNGIDLSPFDVDRNAARVELRALLGLASGARVLGVLGNLTPDKGHRYLVDALAMAGPSHDGVDTVLIGDGDERGNIEERARRAGLAHRLHFLGTREDVPRLLAGLDLLVQSSLREGMPNAVLEAMAAGVPVVATEVGGTAEALGDCGVLVAPADPAPLAEGIRRVLENPARWRENGLQGRARVESHFSLREMVGRTEDLYERLLERRPL